MTDTSDGYEDIDLGLMDPGLVADTRVDEEAPEQLEQSHPALAAAIEGFNGLRRTVRPAVCCVIRVDAAATPEPGVADRIGDRLEKAVQVPDFCVRTGPADYALALDGCDAATARRRLNLMIRLIQLDAAFQAGTPSIWAGVAPVGADGAAPALRTARLACDLASFQASGHVEIVEL